MEYEKIMAIYIVESGKITAAAAWLLLLLLAGRLVMAGNSMWR